MSESLMQAFAGNFVQVSGDSVRNSVVMALLMLLGSRPQDRFGLQLHPDLEYTILGFGVNDLHQLRNNRQVESYCEDLAQKIQNFDCRLSGVTVKPDKSEEAGRDTLRLLITARLADHDDVIGLSTDIRLIDGNCEIRETGGD
ncbi:hypothetical protein M3P05_14355 [Sansalvadorimonas sp. 2012CJ34-2]|uniref:IraD/Gp25-like domain-containing protein n=1 Tax=Parendozoicomonas callyspongiae TaxID=2942213 RepID=A0ABT0PIA6_9GAMM|nr:hypothetical protein [Sansalvadorimonas sp. 2012CJ34-2]MCL6271104.1 hypothetical protein [Sansalvadorimonas sp. 2012CJ34-2]